jgi:hypothetical protein
MWLVAAIVVAAVAAITAANAPASAASAITIRQLAGQRVQPGYGETVRLGQLIGVSGTAAHAPVHAQVQLQGRVISGWHALMAAPLRGDRFTLRWRVRTREFQLRVVLLSGRRRIATSAVASVLVGPAIVRCQPAAPPADLPAGDGVIEGGVYLQGGPAPGMDQCQSSPSAVTATSASGYVVSQNLAGGDGYALVVPAGAYRLQDGECTGQATVVAGRRTVADTDCDFP